MRARRGLAPFYRQGRRGRVVWGRSSSSGEGWFRVWRADGIGRRQRRWRQLCSGVGASWRPSNWSWVRGVRPRGQVEWTGVKPGADSVNPRRIAVGAGVRYAVREREERDAVSGILVNNSKFCIQFTKLNFSPFSWPQKKTVEYHFCSVFRDLQLSFQALFHLSNGL